MPCGYLCLSLEPASKHRTHRDRTLVPRVFTALGKGKELPADGPHPS